jgi:hypothetical protein
VKIPSDLPEAARIGTIVRSIVIGLFGVAASVAFAAVPLVNVTVTDSSGKTAYKGATNGNGTFATGKLQPGGHVVAFNAGSAAKGEKYTLVVSAGKKKVMANAIEAERLAGGGVAMKIDVGAGLNITGQVAAENKNSAPMGHNGKPMVWISQKLGSNMRAHWAESDSAEAKEAQTSSRFSIKNIQDKQSQGINPQGGR